MNERQKRISLTLFSCERVNGPVNANFGSKDFCCLDNVDFRA